ncbi:MAG: hypothetical protein MRQ09_04585 [Candidatus Midichloria sp.]|nr:hypothetical protein [Candidatus Midichloria sp.]
MSTQSLDDYISGDKEAVQVSKVLQKYVGQIKELHSLVPTKLVYTTPNPQSANHYGAEKRLGLNS